MKYEFTEEEIKIIWQMIDVCLKAGGLSNLEECQKIINALNKPIKE